MLALFLFSVKTPSNSSRWIMLNTGRSMFVQISNAIDCFSASKGNESTVFAALVEVKFEAGVFPTTLGQIALEIVPNEINSSWVIFGLEHFQLHGIFNVSLNTPCFCMSAVGTNTQDVWQKRQTFRCNGGSKWSANVTSVVILSVHVFWFNWIVIPKIHLQFRLIFFTLHLINRGTDEKAISEWLTNVCQTDFDFMECFGCW